MRKELLIVDGYNMIGAWPPLVALKQQQQLEQARDALLQALSRYQAIVGMDIIVVFDAQFVPGIQQVFHYHKIEVVFTAADETADMYIERIVPYYQSRLVQVIVATSDLMEQWQIFRQGAVRKSAFELYRDIERSQQELSADVLAYNRTAPRRITALNDYQRQLLEQLRQQLDK